MKASTLRALFDRLRRQLVPVVEAIASQPPADDACLRLHFPEAKQLAFGLEIIKRFGYDFTRGRQDKTPHPFMTKFSLGDVRITTRIDEYHLSEALFGAMHEAGHALYEQGIDPAFEGTPLADGCSAGVHEAQSRLWENLVGRSRGFWQFFFLKLQSIFPKELKSIPLDTFYRAINKVERSPIRTAADEVTYNLHVMIRFGLELDLLAGDLAVADLAEAWRDRYRDDLGKAHPEIPEEISRGGFETLLGWLRENIYRHGNKYTPNELIERVTGGPLDIEPYIRYLKTKYGELYEL
jgi:carboxypeptidase Taq